ITEQQLTQQTLSQLIQHFTPQYQNVQNNYFTLFPRIQQILINFPNQAINIFILSTKHTQLIHPNFTILPIKHYFTQLLPSHKLHK
ncbi:HAD hydrolase-like protein, partial [Staphylococcus pettenkoferi]|uniref:HAD hydrolase-like protein n=1 Tax=Staphylococcus pettenkoferi TaxID=170573 RepID=UPI00164299E4